MWIIIVQLQVHTTMADVDVEAAAALNESAKNATGKIPATPEGMAIAYGSLLVMALLPIFFGSYRSVKYHADQKVSTLLTICFVFTACSKFV